MTNEHSGPPTRQNQPGMVLVWARELIRQGELAFRLLLDPRVPIFYKLVPAGTLAYFLFPIDLLPDLALGLGQLDDVALIFLGLKLFIDLCPPDVVAEHRRAIEGNTGDWAPPAEDTIIDVEPHTPSEEKTE